MMSKYKRVLILLCLIMNACSENNNLKYSNSKLWSMAHTFDPNIKLVPITDPNKRVLCINYGRGCKRGSGKKLLIKTVELIVVEFASTKEAREEAVRLNQYYARNWLFDDVRGEPVLESFVRAVFDAREGS